MDEADIDKAILSDPFGDESLRASILKACDAFPDRLMAATAVHPSTARQAKAEVRTLKARGFSVIKALGVFSGVQYDDPKYFSVFSACEEEELVLTCNVGLALVPISGMHQNPLTLDPMLEHFPDLKVVMCHGGMPWAETCVAMMRKWPNLFWMSSDIAPHAMPPEIIRYARSDGSDRIIMATGFPALSFDEQTHETKAGGLFEGELGEKYAIENGRRVFLAEK